MLLLLVKELERFGKALLNLEGSEASLGGSESA